MTDPLSTPMSREPQADEPVIELRGMTIWLLVWENKKSGAQSWRPLFELSYERKRWSVTFNG